MEDDNREEFVELVSVQGEMEAQVIRGVLESEDVRVSLNMHISQSVYPLTVDGLGKVDILVHRDDLEKARGVIREYRRREE